MINRIMIETADKLMRSVEDAEPRLRAISDAQASERRDGAGWSRKEVLGHLIDSASNNHQRFVRMQFADNLDLPRYAQEDWVRSQGYSEAAWDGLVSLWSAYNRHLSNVIRRIPEDRVQHKARLGDLG